VEIKVDIAKLALNEIPSKLDYCPDCDKLTGQILLDAQTDMWLCLVCVDLLELNKQVMKRKVH
jgi:hypothetical protein